MRISLTAKPEHCVPEIYKIYIIENILKASKSKLYFGYLRHPGCIPCKRHAEGFKIQLFFMPRNLKFHAS